jgi:pilus assembly protein CpaB
MVARLSAGARVVLPVTPATGRPTLKRSNRLILLIGFFLAAVAFVAVVMLLGSGTGGGGNEPGVDALNTTVVVTTADVPLGTTLTASLVTTQDVRNTDKPAGSYTLTSEVIGRTVTTQLTKGQLVDGNAFSTTTVNPDIARLLDPGLRAMSLEVSYISGVGTLIKPGDRVDVVVGISGAAFPVVTTDPTTDLVTPVTGINSTSVKAIVQNLEVVGTLLPYVPPAEGEAPPPGPSSAGAVGTQLVILGVTAQQAEVLRFAQSPDTSITLILRSPEDEEAPDEKTTGITLRQLVDKWAVIPPQLIEAVPPKK